MSWETKDQRTEIIEQLKKKNRTLIEENTQLKSDIIQEKEARCTHACALLDLAERIQTLQGGA